MSHRCCQVITAAHHCSCGVPSAEAASTGSVMVATKFFPLLSTVLTSCGSACMQLERMLCSYSDTDNPCVSAPAKIALLCTHASWTLPARLARVMSGADTRLLLEPSPLPARAVQVRSRRSSERSADAACMLRCFGHGETAAAAQAPCAGCEVRQAGPMHEEACRSACVQPAQGCGGREQQAYSIMPDRGSGHAIASVAQPTCMIPQLIPAAAGRPSPLLHTLPRLDHHQTVSAAHLLNQCQRCIVDRRHSAFLQIRCQQIATDPEMAQRELSCGRGKQGE